MVCTGQAKGKRDGFKQPDGEDCRGAARRVWRRAKETYSRKDKIEEASRLRARWLSLESAAALKRKNGRKQSKTSPRLKWNPIVPPSFVILPCVFVDHKRRPVYRPTLGIPFYPSPSFVICRASSWTTNAGQSTVPLLLLPGCTPSSSRGLRTAARGSCLGSSCTPPSGQPVDREGRRKKQTLQKKVLVHALRVRFQLNDFT